MTSILVTVIAMAADGSIEAADEHGRRWTVPADALDARVLRAHPGQRLRIRVDDDERVVIASL